MIYRVLFTFIILSCFTITNLKAQVESHKVQKSETLYSISKMYKVKIDDLKKWNRLNDNSLAIGQILLVEDPLKEKIIPVQFEGAKEELKIYSVVKGDNLYKISKKFGKSIEEIKRINNLTNSQLSIDQELIIEIPSVKNIINENEKSILKIASYSIHTVKNQENIDSILAKYDMYRSEIEYLNPNIQLNELVLGQQLNVIERKTNPRNNKYLISDIRNTSEDVDSNQIYYSFFNDNEYGSNTSNGELLEGNSLTIAHDTFKLGSIVLIRNTLNNYQVLARVNHRSKKGLIFTKGVEEILQLRDIRLNSHLKSNLILELIN